MDSHFEYNQSNDASTISVESNHSSGSYQPQFHYSTAVNAGFVSNQEDGQPRTLYIGNLDSALNEDFIVRLFERIGSLVKTKMISDPHENTSYAFVEFEDHDAALQAIKSVNNRFVLDRQVKVCWATSPAMEQKTSISDKPTTNDKPSISDEPSISAKPSISDKFCIFVGDLSIEVENNMLKEAFLPFGEVIDARAMFDLQTLMPKGFGFVTYAKREEAEKAMEQMNGQFVGRRAVRTNWATRTPANHVPEQSKKQKQPQIYEEILSQVTSENTSVYISNVPYAASDDDIYVAFKRFGIVRGVRNFKNKGFAFVDFDAHESAAKAIHEMNGSKLVGQLISCQWSKTSGPRSLGQGANAIPFGNNFQQQRWQLRGPPSSREFQGF